MSLGEVERVLREVPVARGRLAKEQAQSVPAAVNRMAAQSELLAGQGFFARLAALVSGRSQKRRALIDTEVMGELTNLDLKVENLRIRGLAVDADIAVVAGHLRRLQFTAAHAENLVSRTAGGLAELGTTVADVAELVEFCEVRLSEHGKALDTLSVQFSAVEARLAAVESRVDVVVARHAGDDDLDVVTERWAAGRTYPGVPWLTRTALLAQEVFAGPCGLYEYLDASGPKRTRFRDLLAQRVLDSSRPPDGGLVAVTRLLVAELDELRSTPEPGLVAESLGERLVPALAPVRGPWVEAVAKAATVISLDTEHQRSPDVGAIAEAALAEAQTVRGFLPGALRVERLVGQVIDEQAEAAMSARRMAAATATRVGTAGRR